MEIDDAISDIRRGRIVLIYDGDGREEETDLVVAAEHATPSHIRTMRKDGGGLICAAVHPDIAVRLGLPFQVDLLRYSQAKYPVLGDLEPNDIPYDEKSAFSITINHRRTFTGITDKDRSLTIRELARIGSNALNGYDPEEFGRNFRSPGHVVLLKAADGLLAKRRGHTELSTALMELAGVTPIAVICEMLGDDGNSLRRAEAEAYARTHGLRFLEGREIVEKFNGNGEGKQRP